MSFDYDNWKTTEPTQTSDTIQAEYEIGEKVETGNGIGMIVGIQLRAQGFDGISYEVEMSDSDGNTEVDVISEMFLLLRN